MFKKHILIETDLENNELIISTLVQDIQNPKIKRLICLGLDKTESISVAMELLRQSTSIK